MKRTLKKIIEITDITKRFTTFPIIIKHEKYVIDNREKMSENSNELFRYLFKDKKDKSIPSLQQMNSIGNEFLRSLFGDKIPTSHEQFHENAINQNEKPQRAE